MCWCELHLLKNSINEAIIIYKFSFSDSNHFKAQALKNAENAYHIHQARVSLKNEKINCNRPWKYTITFYLGGFPLVLIF